MVKAASIPSEAIEIITVKIASVVKSTVKDITEEYLPEESNNALILDLISTLQDEITIFLINEFKKLLSLGIEVKKEKNVVFFNKKCKLLKMLVV